MAGQASHGSSSPHCASGTVSAPCVGTRPNPIRETTSLDSTRSNSLACLPHHPLHGLGSPATHNTRTTCSRITDYRYQYIEPSVQLSFSKTSIHHPSTHNSSTTAHLQHTSNTQQHRKHPSNRCHHASRSPSIKRLVGSRSPRRRIRVRCRGRRSHGRGLDGGRGDGGGGRAQTVRGRC